MEPTRVLVAEDDGASRTIIARVLERNGYRVVTAADGRRALALAGPDVEVALIDWMMPGADGVAVCRRIKEATAGSGYVIMVTARAGKADIVHALESGADDYLTKPIDHDELLARVRAGERIAGRERELASAWREARDEAERDALTGLFSRRHFDRALPAAVAEASPSRPLSLLLADLDHFKRINDLHGHRVGDQVLREAAGVVEAVTRRGVDVPARYGGEELAVIAPHTTASAACEIAERVRARVAALRIPARDGLVSVTVSIGVAQLRGPAGSAHAAAAQLIEEADMRLYQAKHAGRNRVAA